MGKEAGQRGVRGIGGITEEHAEALGGDGYVTVSMVSQVCTSVKT